MVSQQPAVRDFRMEAEVTPGGNGVDLILGHTRLPAHGILAKTSLQGSVQGKADQDVQSYMEVMLSAWWLPLYDDDATDVPTQAEIEAIFNKRVSGVTAVHDETNADEVITFSATPGDAKTGLLWRPDAFQADLLIDNGSPLCYWMKKIKLGWDEGMAYRPGAANKVRYQASFEREIKRSIQARQQPGVLAYVVTIPPTNALDATIDQTRPQGNSWRKLDFLAPPRSPLGVMDDSQNMSSVADYTHWAIQRVQHQAGSFNVPDSLYVKLFLTETYARQIVMPQIQTPNQVK